MGTRQKALLVGHQLSDNHVFKPVEIVARCVTTQEQTPERLEISSLNELKHLLIEHEINLVLVQPGSDELFLPYKDLLISTGLPIYQTSQPEWQVLANPPKKDGLLVVKRLIDILSAIIGLGLMGIVGLVIYPIVQKQSPGALLFSQERIGKNGKRFKMYKFRSMHLDAEEQKLALMAQNEVASEHMFKLENDPRIFPFGQKMRQWSIDELPQFINVLKGDMSLIGTRPPTVDEYSKYDFHHFKRLAMKPGITGLWQVSGRSNIKDFEDVVRLDAYYIDHWSLWFDIKILLKTVKVVVMKEGSR